MTLENKLNWIKTLSIFSAIIAIIILLMPALLGEQKFALGNAAEVASAVATTAVLLVGILAITIVVAVESAEFKATEQVKVDLLSLAATISSIMRKVGASKGLNSEVASLEFESNELQKFSAGVTALALQSWSAKDRKSKDGKNINLLFFFVCLVQGIMILRTSEKSKLDTTNCAQFFAPMYIVLAQLTEAHVLEIAKEISNINNAVSASLDVASKDPFIRLVLSTYEKHENKDKDDIKHLRALKARGVDDPDLDLFIAVDDENLADVKSAIELGANRNIQMKTLIDRYKDVVV